MTSWQPIETAPKTGEPFVVLVLDPIGKQRDYRVMRWDTKDSLWFWAGRSFCPGETYAELIPTHWMPLPKPPQEGDKE